MSLNEFPKLFMQVKKLRQICHAKQYAYPFELIM